MNSFNKRLFESFDSLESCTLKENAKNELVSWMYDNFPDNSFYKEGKLGNGDTVYYFDKHGDMEVVKKAIKDKFGDQVDFGTGRGEYAPERSEFVVICKKKPKLKEASTKDAYLRDIAKEAYEVGKPYDIDDFNTFRKIGREDGYVLTHSDFDKYFEYYDEARSGVEESDDLNRNLLGEDEEGKISERMKKIADQFYKDKEEGKIPERMKKIADQERYDRLFDRKSEEGMSEEKFKSIYGERPKTGLEENYTGKDLKEALENETYHIVVWETEEDRDNGDPFETMEEYDSKEEAIKDAKKLARDNACVEVKNSVGKTVLTL